MFSERSTRQGTTRSVSASMVVHLLVIAAILGYAYRHPIRVVNSVGTVSGKRTDLVYLPGKTPASATSHPAAKRKPTEAAKLTRPLAPLPPALPAIPLPPLPHVVIKPATPAVDSASLSSGAPDQTSTSNSSTSGDAEQIALTTYSPSPVPDLSVLPRGVQGDVIVDITITTDGRIGDLKVLKTVGYGIESTVVNTVRTWTFRPATKDGVPVASVQELLFHFARSESP